MRREEEDAARKFNARIKRTHRRYRPDDGGGRPLPEAAKDAMRRKPYSTGRDESEGKA